MNDAQDTSTSHETGTTRLRDKPLWTVPVILGILMLGAGGLFVLVAHGLSILSAIG